MFEQCEEINFQLISKNASPFNPFITRAKLTLTECHSVERGETGLGAGGGVDCDWY